MQVFDASSMIHAWDNYPIRQFSGLWAWMADQIKEANLMMPSVAFDEVEKKTPDCGQWLKEQDLRELGISNAIVHDAARIKGLLGIVGDKYHPRGVGENDILIIAVARASSAELVSDEQRQSILPKELWKRRIPAVCSLPEVSVSCINFVGYMKRSEVRFG